MKKIGIIGCGWLGKPLAKELSKHHDVECYTRHKDYETQKELNYIYNPDSDHKFWKNEIIIVAISTKDRYLETLQKISQYSVATSLIILMSSTSVYREFDKEVDESAVITKRGVQKEAEELLINSRQRSVILRLGGLMGEDRVSGKWKSVSEFSDGEVNYIHQADAIKITKQIVETDITDGIFNLVAPKHPLRSTVHKKNSEKFGFSLGSFKGLTHRIVSSDSIIKTLKYTFVYPDPLYFWD